MPRFRSLSLIAIATAATALTPATGQAATKRGKQKSAKQAKALPAYPKSFQKRFHTGPKSDPDKDGLSSYYEYLAKTNPRRADSDHDGLKDAREDGDKDGLRNRTEQRVGSDPHQTAVAMSAAASEFTWAPTPRPQADISGASPIDCSR